MTTSPAQLVVFRQGFHQQKHFETEHSSQTVLEPFLCHLCGNKAKKSSSMVNHVKTWHTDVRVSCDLCGKIFESMSQCVAHLKTNHVAVEAPCGKVTRSQYHIKKHPGESHVIGKGGGDAAKDNAGGKFNEKSENSETS